MRKSNDLTGKQFGRLTVLCKDEDAARGHGTFWICQCSCGNTKSIRNDSLTSGKTISCGCVQKERASRPHSVNDITGMKFGRLVVLGREYDKTKYQRKTNEAVWRCKCDCGKITLVTGYDLRSGNTQSCGCGRGNHTPDITGQKFGTLTVLRRNYQYGETSWWCRCDCGVIKSVRASALKAGTTKTCGRETCRDNVRSNGEVLIDTLLSSLKIKFEAEKTFDGLFGVGGGLLRFDFYLPDYDIAIEYDGEQHYKLSEYFGGDKTYLAIKTHDEFKDQYCKDHHIQLIRIPYWKTNEEIKEIINNIQESRNDHSAVSNDSAYADNSSTLMS